MKRVSWLAVVLLGLTWVGASCSRDAASSSAADAGGAGGLGGAPEVCSVGQTECGADCVNTESDPEHCGECGEACAFDEVCSMGECAVECADQLTNCSGACADLESDASHCGACRRECTGGQRCSSGRCACAEDEEWCDDRCVSAGDCEPATSDAGGGGGSSASTPTMSSSSTSQGGGGGGAGGSTQATATTGGEGECVFSIDDELSPAVATVGIVSFSATNISIDKAEIEFTRASGGPTYVAPVDLDEPDYRTLLLGMKDESDYEYRIILNDGECTSPTRTITTGPLANSLPTITKNRPLAAAAAPGFMITSSGIGNIGDSGSLAYILDYEGDIVWWAKAPASCSRAKMDWEGKHMVMMMLNVRYSTNAGAVRRTSMDGLVVEERLSGLNGGHHDFTVTPGGNIVAIVHQNNCSGIVERTPAGDITTIVSDVHEIYEPMGECHPNSIHYHPDDDSFTISDRNPDLFVKISREGEVLWQLGGGNPIASLHYQGTWAVNHGHHVLPNGNFLFFNNGAARSESPVLEFELTEPEATLVWSYSSEYSSPTLGDVQRLPNGNTLITYSNAGVIQEVDRDQRLVQQFGTTSLGYVEHRPTLYGPPPR